MPYVQYGGGVLALFLSSPGAQSSEGSLQAFQAVCYLGVESLGVQPVSTWGAFPFIVQGGAPYLHISIVMSWFRLGVLHLRQSPGPTQSVGSGEAWAQLVFLGNGLSSVRAGSTYFRALGQKDTMGPLLD